MLPKKNARKALVLIFCAIFFLSLSAMVHASPASQALVVEGRDLLFNEGDYIVSGILAADTKFEAAVTADPSDEEANFFYAVTRVLVFGLEQDNGPNFDTLATLGDFLGAFGMIRNTNDFIDEGDGPFNEPPEMYDDYDPPDTVPSGEEIRTFFAGPFVSLMDSAIGNIDAVSSSFETTLYAWETGDRDIEVDYGDVMIVKSWLYTLKSFALIISAYDLDIPDTAIHKIIALDNADLFQFQRDLLDEYANVFDLRGDGSTSLTNAKDALMLGIDSYRDSITFIIGESDFQEDDLLYFDSTRDEHSAQHILTLLTELQDKFNANDASIFTTTEQKWLLTDGGTSGQLNLEIELDPDDNIADESAWGAVFGLNGNGTVDDYSIDGSIVTMVLVAGSYPCPGSSSFSTTLTGTMNGEGDQITGGTYVGTDCFGPISGTFTGVRTCEETDSETIDFGWLFGNTGKDPLDIRATLPGFDTYDEAIPGSFPSPVLNNLLPDYSTNELVSRKFNLQPNGNFNVPTVSAGTITIDGTSTDWPGGAVVFTDVLGDGDPDRPGTDIEKVYLATDGADLCMAMSLYDDDPNTDINTYYKFRFRKKGGDSTPEVEIWVHYNGASWEGGARKGPQYGWEAISLSGGSVASGTKFLELKVPLADIEGAVGSLNGTFVSVHIDTAPLAPNCDLREYEEDNDTRIKLNSTAGIAGTITCSTHTSGAISIWVYDDTNIDTANVLGSTYIAAPGPYTIDGLPDDANVFVVAFWDINTNGILNFGDYYGYTPVLVNLPGGLTTTVDIDVNNTLDNTWMKTKPGKYRLFGSSTYTFEGSYGSDPNEIDWHDSNWIYIGEGDSAFTFTTAEHYDTILMIWHEDSNFFFDSFEDLTAGTAFATGEGGSPVGYQWVTRGLVNSDNSDLGGEPYYFKGYADESYTKTRDGYGFNLFTMPSDSLPWDDDRQLKVTFDMDTDDDGLMDHVETDIGTDLSLWDSDGDRMPDGWEYTYGLDPLTDDSGYDRDEDGVSNLEEYHIDAIPNDSIDGFTVQGSVMNRHHQDESFSSLISVVIGGDFSGNLPEDIEYITVEGPNGYLPYGKNDYTYTSQWREFDLVIPGSPAIGEYTFTVKQKDRDAMGKARDIQGIIRTIPVPTIISPAPDATVTSKTPIFSWQAVDYPDTPLYYRLQIKDDADNLILSTGREHGMLSCTAPELTSGQSYYWRVRVSDSDDFYKVQNRSQTDWIPFTVSGAPTHSAVPAIDLDGWGVVTWTTDGGTNLSIEVKVIDHDGISYDGSSHTVTVTFPDGITTYDMIFDYYESTTAAVYWYGYNLEGSPATPGTYTFTVKDPDYQNPGDEVTATDTLVVQPLDPPDETSITPSNYNESITATFDNVVVNGLPYDNFDSYGTNIDNLDPFKWKGWDSSVSSIENQKLKHTISNTIGRGHAGVSFSDPESINAIQADITITDVSSLENRAEIYGNFFSNGIQDITARISVEGDRVFYSVGEEWISQGNYSWSNLAKGDLMTATVGQTITASISWNGTYFEFDADGNTATYTPAGPIYSPIFHNGKHLRTRINLITDATPTLTWDPVLNANRHRVRIYNYDNSRTIWRGNTGIDSSYTVPPGILSPDSIYKFRIGARDTHNPLEIDNASKTPASNNDNYIFYTGEEEAVDPLIDLDNHGVGVWNSELAGPILDFWIKVHDAQGVPANIKSVKVTFPGSAEEVLYYDEGNRYNTSTCGIYRSNSFLPIESGTYTFFVEDQDGHTHTLTEVLTYDPINPLGYPPESTLTPAHNTLVGDTAADFDWEDVADVLGGEGFYHLEIYDKDYNRIYAFGTIESQFNLPAGFLEEKTLYRYRINTRREFFDQNVDNGSSSPRSSSTAFTFTTTSMTGGSSSPILDLENKGVYVSHAINQGQPATSYYWLMFEAKVTDDDGVPGNIASVRVTYPDGVTFKDLIYDDEISSTEASYWGMEMYGDPVDIPQGTYTFRVTDFDDNFVELTDDLVVNVLPAPANLVPGQDSAVAGTTPAILWDDVAGAGRYRVRIYDGWNGTLHWSDYLTTSSYTVPADVLELNTTYSYRVYAYREIAPTEDVDNVSINSLHNSERSHFTTGSTGTDSDGDGIPDGSDPCPLDFDNDIDGDGICGDVDPCPNDPDNTDTDLDGTVDCADNYPDNPDDNPTLDSPLDEALLGDMSETLLETSGFVDTPTVTHEETQWQIRRADRVYGCDDYDPSFNYTATTGDLTSHTVSGLESGMQYAWRVGYKDSEGATSWSDEYTFTVGTSETDNSVQTTPGTDLEEFEMISFTHWPDDPAATAVLGDELGTSYDTFQFRIGTYDPELGDYIEYDGDLEIEPGRAYWVLTRNVLDVFLDGVPVSMLNDMEIGLGYNSGTGNGWNMIGCPNDANYLWDNVMVIEYDTDGSIIFGPTAVSALSDPNDYIDTQLWRWDNGAYYTDTTLMEKYKGYWVKAEKANVYLRFPVGAQAGLSSPRSIMVASFTIRAKRWLKKWILTPQSAIAGSGESPPMPMGDLKTASSTDSGYGGGGGCFIATAAYGSPMAPHVKVLREFRDRFMLTHSIGKIFVDTYYKTSPAMADFIKAHAGLKPVVRISLLPIVGISWMALQHGTMTTIALTLFFIMGLIGLLRIRRKKIKG